MSKATTAKLLSSVPLFEGLSKRDVSRLVELGRETTFEVGREIVTEGNQGVAFHLILKGQARVLVGGRSRAKLVAGDYFGEISLIDQGPRTATVKAEVETTTFGITTWEFLPLLDANPKITRHLLTQLCSRVRAAEKSLHL